MKRFKFSLWVKSDGVFLRATAKLQLEVIAKSLDEAQRAVLKANELSDYGPFAFDIPERPGRPLCESNALLLIEP